MPDFGDLLRRLRGNRPQRDVALELNLPVTTLSTLENQKQVPRGAVLKQLCTYYGVPPAYFYAEPSTQARKTDAAMRWLQMVKDNSAAKEAIAFYAPIDVSDALKNRIAERLRQMKNAQIATGE